MNKTKNLFRTLIILSVFLASCGDREVPIPSNSNEVSIYEFESTYKYIKGTSRIFDMTISKDFTNSLYVTMTTLANPSGNPDTLTDITRLSDSSFLFNYRWGNIIYGDAMLFLDKSGQRKLYIDHSNGKEYNAIEY